ncbi:MAG: Mrp/NBP35 family ATP-binding protein [Alphaproteobacteria bacterium]|nr:Mrp/NBP35 family ATP-binding protein [Alphaproteobacteria bacterium]
MSENPSVRAVAEQFFASESIESAVLNNGRAVVTINSEENSSEVVEDLKKQLLKIPDVRKANVVFTSSRQNASDNHWQIRGVKKIIAVASGKGGVGKSTTAVNIALALSRLNYTVALFDADIYGPSVPTMLGYEDMELTSYDGKTFEPFEIQNIQTMSIGTLIGRDTPLIWRAPKACGALQQLLADVNWHNVDVMVIDMPPGTGDIQITLSQQVRLNGAVIVSTPQDIALIDAVKGVNMFKAVSVPILGIVENMSYHICKNCGHKEHIFGNNGAYDTAQKMDIDFLGGIPLELAIRFHADNGTPIVVDEPDSDSAKAYMAISQKIADKLF